MTGVFDHSWLGGLFGDAEAEALWAPQAQLDHYVAFEVALARSLETVGLVPSGAGARAADTLCNTQVAPGDLAAATARDGVPVPELVRRWRAGAGPDSAAVHFGATSQDVLDTALSLTLRKLTDLLLARIAALDDLLGGLTRTFGAGPLMGRTRMQAAQSITVADRLDEWRLPLHAPADELVSRRAKVELLQLGGAVGTRAAYGDDAARVAALMAGALGLNAPPRAWHTDRSGVASYAGCLSLITGAMGKMGQDIALMAQQGIDEIALTGGGGSSAMPHKSNPVLAELLVTLARFNATLLPGIHHALVHEQERSGAAWMLEWMMLPQMAMAASRALAAGAELCRRVERLGSPPVRPQT